MSQQSPPNCKCPTLGHHASSQAHTTRYDCVVCLDELPARKMAKLKCSHRMCNSCLKRAFKLSIMDPQHMPPKCCTADFVPLKHVDQLFDRNFKKTWNKKFVEYSARNRVYCPKRSCGEFIRPEDIRRGSDGKKIGQCAKCSTKVCVKCASKAHKGDCPKDEETVRFLAKAKDEGWQRCLKCKAMIELQEGCNHMTWYVLTMVSHICSAPSNHTTVAVAPSSAMYAGGPGKPVNAHGSTTNPSRPTEYCTCRFRETQPDPQSTSL